MTVTALEDEYGTEEELNAVVEGIRLAVVAGSMPNVAHATNVYDTIACLLALHRSGGGPAQELAEFDLVLSLVGWIPGAGPVIRKTIRIVNVYQAYVPVLFEMLRNECSELDIRTSPKLLLDKLFSEVALTPILETVQSSIAASWTYDQMPSDAQQSVSSFMSDARAAFPAILTRVVTKLSQWTNIQRGATVRLSSMKAGLMNCVEINRHWPDLVPFSGCGYRAVFADGTSKEGTLDSNGYARLEGIPAGLVEVHFGEDPSPYEVPRCMIDGNATEASVRKELERRDCDTDAEGVDFLLENLSGRSLQ